MTTSLPQDQRLLGISSKAYEHPADRAATAALQSIPMLDAVVRKLIEYGYERALRQVLEGGSVRLGVDQLPEVWLNHRAALARLDLDEEHDLFLRQSPTINAMAIGSGKPLVVVNSRAVELLDEHELRAVFGHEAGHILSDHVLYRTALMILISLSGIGRLPVMMGLPLTAVRLALLEWFRTAELSCDRAATLVAQDPLVTCRTLMVMAGGAASRKLNLDAFVRQASEYEELEWGWDRVARLRVELEKTHAFPVRRVRELMDWVYSGEYDHVVGGEYPRRSNPTNARHEVGDAADFYAERFRKIFREVSQGMEKAGDKVADVAGRLGEWLRSGRAGR